MKRIGYILLALFVGMIALTCSSDLEPSYISPWDGTEIDEFYIFENAGIYPDTSILQDPNNPFRYMTLTESIVWDINNDAPQSYGGYIYRFYAWATLLARGPYGTPQFYVAENLFELTRFMNVKDVKGIEKYRKHAERAYMSVLDNFLDGVSYDIYGAKFPLAPIVYDTLRALGSVEVTNGYEKFESLDGTTIVLAARNK